MSNPSDLPVQVIARATFSQDMVSTMDHYFDHYAVEGILTVEVTNWGLWLKNPNGGRQFLGSTEPLGQAPAKTKEIGREPS